MGRERGRRAGQAACAEGFWGAPGFGVLLVVVERGWRAKGQQGAEPWCLQDVMRSPEPALGVGARHW